MEKLDNQPCPFCGKNALSLVEDEMEIPYFGKVFVFSMNCTSCKYSKSDVEAEEIHDPTKCTFVVENSEDMKVRIVKSSAATVKLPGLRMSMEPGTGSDGFITNVEGLINRFEKIVQQEKDNADDPAIRKKAKNLLKKIRKIKWGEIETKLIIEDPNGNSAIISDKTVVEKLKDVKNEKLFLEARADVDVLPLVKKIKDKSLKYGLLGTVQHVHQLDEIKEILKNSVIGGQVLGCDVSNAMKIKDKVDLFIFIGSGEFHPLEIAFKTGLKVLVLNPFSGLISEVKKDERRVGRIKGAYLKYLSSDKIGILVSTKEGQNRLEDVGKIKKGYVFLFDTLDFSQLENFNNIDVWVNTACPRIAYEDYDKFPKAVINIDDILSQQNL